jgi:hypothetical protein
MVKGTREPRRAVGAVSARSAFWLAWSLAALCVAMFLARVALWFLLVRSVQVSGNLGGDLPVVVLLLYLPFLAFPIVGALIASGRPENPIGWILLADGLLWMLVSVTDFYGVYGLALPGSVSFPLVMAGLNNWLWVPAVGLFGTYLLLLFPDGRLPSRRWRLLAWLSGAVIVLASMGVMLAPGPLQELGGVHNPFGVEGVPWVGDAGTAVLRILPLCMLASATSLVTRYRRSRGEVRQQIKWIAFAASVVVIVYLLAVVASFVVPSVTWFAAASPLWLNILEYAALVSLTAVPIAVGFAVSKYRLYDLDVVINRTLVYGSLTALLALVYLGGVTAAQAIFRTLTGQQEQPQLAIVISTLIIAALFNPLRRRIQSFIDRRFYRGKYDAAKTLGAFSAKLRDETDLDALSNDLVGVIKETMQPAHVSLWLLPELPPMRSEGPE